MSLPRIVNNSRMGGQPLPGHGHYGGVSAHQYPAHPHGYASLPPAPPPSPPVEDNAKYRLPSISALLLGFDGTQPPHTNGTERQQSQPPRGNLPPTPPMRPDSVFEGGNSPTMAATSPSSSNYYYPAPTYNGGSGNPHRNSYPPAQQKSVYPSPTETTYSAQHGYYSPQQHADSYSSKQPPQLMVPMSVAPPSSSNPWHHHHHQSPASHAAFPQSQDRYICQTCNKAFSRPSSLRIHSHSHTGEKPFKCPHHGCGKAFSVRSNMKRHERGCHQ
ncbi:hypothetical protein K440DRAFT_580634 [Wilcoxina mikolae CBS 423.85]|nr:hypothetical protein K440DRAFT_580634 [Wilcoxina mikolae CBS 423.85]